MRLIHYAVKILCVAIVSMVLVSCAVTEPVEVPASLDTLNVTILKIGKADAIVLQQASHTLVIDCGETEDGEELLQFLQSKGIDTLDALIITHFDKDHVGGAEPIISNCNIRRILVPAYEGSNTEYANFTAALQAKDITAERLTSTVRFSLGNVEVRVDAPLDYSVTEKDPDETGEIDNNLSLITTVTHGENHLVFMGDAQKKRIREWLTTDAASPCDFVKMPHHGRYNKGLPELLNVLQPEFAAITDSAKNPAEEKTLELLAERSINTFQTQFGDIFVTSDGTNLSVTQ